jgi:L-threonylcarbamoyladenylate synthase
VIRRFDVCQPDELERGLAAATAAARRGELVVLPTESAYGIATDAFSAVGLAKLRQAKNRGPELPVPVMIGAAMTADGLMSGVTAEARDLMTAFWPGQLTLIGIAQPTLTWEVGAAGDRSVSVRMPIHPVTWQLAKRLGPLALTGANMAGADLPLTCDEASDVFGSTVAIYLDAGPCTRSATSTVVDISVSPPELLREGAITATALQEICPDLVIHNDGTAIPSEAQPTGADSS